MLLSSKPVSLPEIRLKRKPRQDAALIAIVLIFLAAMMPVAATRVIDSMNFERYYTDAAVSMLQSHDYFSPLQGDGELRLHKPLPIYWILIASYKLLGISFFSTRIPFLLIACATIWLAAKVALRVTADVRCARATALILLSNVLLMTVSARATQDILVTFALLMSGAGFIRLICCDDTSSSAYWSAYGGAGLGVATKGLLPVVFVVYALVFAALTSRFRRVLHPRIISASVLIACSGFFLMVWKHGWVALQSFWGDQVGNKTGGNVVRIGAYLLVYLGFFLPWLISLAYLFYTRKPEKALNDVQRKTCLFILIWAVLLAIVFGLGDRIQDRYLAPAVPLFAIAIAIALCRFSDASIARIMDPLLNLTTVGFFAIAFFGLTLLWQNGLIGKHLAGVTIGLVAAFLIALRFRRKQLTAQAVFSMSLLLCLPLCLAILSPFTLPDQTAQIAQALKSLNRDKKPILVVGTNKLTSRLRISTGGAYQIQQARRGDLQKAGARADDSIFILTEGEARRLPSGSFHLRQVAVYPNQISLPQLLNMTFKGESKNYIQSRVKRCYAVLATGAIAR